MEEYEKMKSKSKSAKRKSAGDIGRNSKELKEVAELKKELKAAGLATEGKKQELVQRLADHRKAEQKLLDAGDGADVDDTSLEALEANVLGDAADLKAPTPPKPKAPVAAAPAKAATPKAPVTSPEAGGPVSAQKIRISADKAPEAAAEAVPAGSTAAEAKLARAAKFGIPAAEALSADDRKAQRAARFGIAAPPATGKDVTASAPAVDSTKLKSRAERFGLPVNPDTGKALQVRLGLGRDGVGAGGGLDEAEEPGGALRPPRQPGHRQGPPGQAGAGT